MSLSEVKAYQIDSAEAAQAILKEAREAVETGETGRFSEETVQQLMTAALKLYAAKLENEDRFFSPIQGAGELVTPTDVVVSVSEILRAVNLNTFDLAMWFNRATTSREGEQG